MCVGGWLNLPPQAQLEAGVGLHTRGVLPNQGTQVKLASKDTHWKSASMLAFLPSALLIFIIIFKINTSLVNTSCCCPWGGGAPKKQDLCGVWHHQSIYTVWNYYTFTSGNLSSTSTTVCK